MKKIVVIMAGGLGKRMNSDLPKVLHNINDEPMICRLIKTAYKTDPFTILIIVGKYKQIIQSTIEKYLPMEMINIIQYVNQKIALGTGHAINCAIPILSSFSTFEDRILILSGDTPLVSFCTMNSMFDSDKNFAMVTNYNFTDEQSSAMFKDYGKIILKNDLISKIVEKKDCTEDQINISCVNCGIYCYNFEVLIKCIPMIDNKNSQNEYYLTDIIEISNSKNFKTHKYELDYNFQYEIIGVNTQDQLKELEKIITDKKI